jgi:hypothetical protein
VVNDTVRFFSLQGVPLFDTPLEQFSGAGQSKVVTIAFNGIRYFLIYKFRGRRSEQSETHITELSARGEVIARHNLPPLPRSITPMPGWPEVAPALGVPPLLLAAFMTYAYAGHAMGHKFAAEAWNSFRDEPASIWFLCIYCLAAALISTILSLFVARRCVMSKSETVKWALGVFALGPFGLFTLLALREWPARVPCPSCDKKRVVTRELCEHCAAAFPETPLDGTEIFDTYSHLEESALPLRLAS